MQPWRSAASAPTATAATADDAELSPAKQAQLKILNKRLSTLQTEFSQKLLAAAKAGALHVDNAAALANHIPNRPGAPTVSLFRKKFG